MHTNNTQYTLDSSHGTYSARHYEGRKGGTVAVAVASCTGQTMAAMPVTALRVREIAYPLLPRVPYPLGLKHQGYPEYERFEAGCAKK